MAAKTQKYNGFKLKLSKITLRKALKELDRKVTPCSFSKAQKIGVTFVVNSEEELKQIKEAIKIISKSQAEIVALGYIPHKKPEDYYLSQKGLNFFSNKDTDWLYRPKTEQVKEFMETPFDMLFDLGSAHLYPMQYILELSRAKFKIGWFGESEPFDFMMNMKKEQGIAYFCEQAITYLTNLNA